ncbi:MAG: hypothetical protein PWP57_668 [Candidatus Atribacteria bacterium]|nr:hypothetical protein [Candidatus Atribacteria bacterium]
MNHILIRKADESDLPTMEKIMMELINSMDNKEGIDASAVFENCQSLLKENNSHLLIAEINREMVGFINFTIRRTILHSGPSGLIDERA